MVATVDTTAITKLRRKLSADGSTSEAGLIKRSDLVNAIYTELVHRIQTEGIPAPGILTSTNYTTALPIMSGSSTYAADTGRLQPLQTPETFEVNNYIKASRDVSVDNIIDTLLSIVFRMTALRRTYWTVIVDPADSSQNFLTAPWLAMLDLDAQIYYNELDDLARRYNMDTGTDIVGTNGSSTGESTERQRIEHTGVVSRNAAGIPVDFASTGTNPHCIETNAGFLGLGAPGSAAQLLDTNGDPIYTTFNGSLQLIQLNSVGDKKQIYFVANQAFLPHVLAARGDYAVALQEGTYHIYTSSATWVPSTCLKNVAGHGSVVAGDVRTALAINAYTSYSGSGTATTLTTEQASPGLYQLLTDLRELLMKHRTSAPTIDLSTCHSNCHGNCHGSRNRR